MATPSELDIINSNPIKNGLSNFRRLFESARADLGVADSSDAVQAVFSTATIVAKSLLLDLVLALQIEPAARSLPSRIADRTFSGDLASLYTRVDSNKLDIVLAVPLVEQALSYKHGSTAWSDATFWNAVFDLVLEIKSIAPPTVLEKATFDTPLRSSSASQSGTEQTHDEVDQRILEELTGRVYYDVGGFYERFFKGKAWTNKARDIYKESMAQYSEGIWSHWPEPSVQNLFFEWFINFQGTILTGLRGKYYTSANNELRGSEADRKLDIFLAPTDAAFQDGKYDWSNVLVIGEHKRNPDEDRSTKTLVQLAGYAREVFGSQPDRRFLPGFTICGSVMRLWVFDRSGPYNSEKFDIHKEPERFVTVIAGYALMTDAELGLNTFIKRDGDAKYIIARGTKISIEDKPIASTKAIVCRGTTCYRGRGSDAAPQHVVKFAWPSDKRQREGRLLKLAKERGVTGIAEWVHDEQVSIDGVLDTIANLRRGMAFGDPRRLSSKALWVDSPTGSSRATSRTRSSLQLRSRSSIGRLSGLGVPTSSASNSSTGQKRIRDDASVSGNSAMKRSRSNDSQAVIANPGSDGRGPDISNVQSIEEPEDDSLAGRESETYGNRVHTCLVISPAGRPLHSYRSVRELLEAISDAIAAHRSLLEDGKMLHRDISENNLIITTPSAQGEPKGRLIDMDLGKELNSAPSGASHRTGTMQFMAIEVLQGKGHTYRHDLESFFYVFIWMCIRHGHDAMVGGQADKKPRPLATSRLRRWYTGTYAEIADTKLGHMDKNGFENVVAEFAPRFETIKPLARDLRNVLFPIRDGAIFTGTFRDSGIMYDGMIEAFSRVIGSLGKEDQK